MTSQDELWRLFVALELPETWLEALAGAQRALAEAFETPATPRLRWARPEGFHLTLKFLGNFPAGRVEDLRSVLAEAVAQPPNLTLSLGEPGFFTGYGDLVRALWAGVRGDVEGLEALAATVDAACSRLGVAREGRGFTPHLTLARVPDETSLKPQGVREVLARVETLKAPVFDVDHISLMRSHLGPGWSRYERVAAFPSLS